MTMVADLPERRAPAGRNELAPLFSHSVGAALRQGEPAVLLDHPGGAVLVQPAATVTAASLHFAIRHSSGLIHAAMPSADLDRLRIPDQPVLSIEDRGTGFTVAVDAAAGIGTGISAADRAHTLRVLADPGTAPADLIRPGHVLPIRCSDDGYAGRRRVWELAVDFVRAAGHAPVAMACRLVDDDGDILTRDAAVEFGFTHRIAISPGTAGGSRDAR
ncbi:3,4-dihydroxy-2-butanone-4-phosphate synthase [Mycobacterium sp. SMC-4]|uniref:3,4-dihydroxy-2-butanone-4-phosphate synthase n=1 Tax=Mycobacterium sp. SMC-4 TaxID=2857059 RepID=UPI003D015DB4